MSAERATKLPAPGSGDLDERQPLLVSPGSDEIEEIVISTTDPEEQRKLERPDELGWKSYTFYGVLFTLGLLGLTLLIKGFIDAGDVEVRTPLTPLILFKHFDVICFRLV